MKGNIKILLKVLLLSVIWTGNTFAVLAQQAGNVIITGTVLDENNEPLIGASVLAVGIQLQTSTENSHLKFPKEAISSFHILDIIHRLWTPTRIP